MIVSTKINGLKFDIEGNGFVSAGDGAESDFDAIVSRIETRLTAMDPAVLARLHSGSVWTDDGATDETAFEELNAIIDNEADEVLKEWHNPSAASVSIYGRL